MSCPSCGGQLPSVVLMAVGGFLAVPFAIFLVVLLVIRRTVHQGPPDGAADAGPASEEPP